MEAHLRRARHAQGPPRGGRGGADPARRRARSCWPPTRASRRFRSPRSPRAASWPGPCWPCGSCSPEAPETLVFDEVDAGIGGEAGAGCRAAPSPRSAPATRCSSSPTCPRWRRSPTPRSVVVKQVPRGRTVTGAQVPSAEERVQELSRMLAGLGRQRPGRRHADGAAAAAAAVRREGERADGGSATAAVPESSAGARVDRRTKDLVKRLLPGEIAVIDHADLDRVAAEWLIEAGVVAVVNASPVDAPAATRTWARSLIAAAGIPLVDDVGPRRTRLLAEGERGRGGRRRGASRRGAVVAARRPPDACRRSRTRSRQARRSVGEELERFASNTLEYLQQERHLASDSPDLPHVPVSFKGRHALVVVARRRLPGRPRRPQASAATCARCKPVLIGVDGGADALRELGLTARHHHRRLRLGERGDAALRRRR